MFDVNRGLILDKILSAKPGVEVRKDHYWAIGNIIRITPHTIAFKFGRKISREDPIYDESSRDFIMGDVENAECVDAIYNQDLQLLAIQTSSGLPQPWTLANYIAKIINDSWINFSQHLTAEESAVMQFLQAEYKTIRDPRDFLHFIREAYKVKRLTVHFSKSNAWSPAEDFRKPLETHSDKLKADSGTAIFAARNDLDREAVEATAVDASVAGHNVSARIQEEEETSLRTVKMGPKTDPFIVEIEDEDTIYDAHQKVSAAVKPLFKKED